MATIETNLDPGSTQPPLRVEQVGPKRRPEVLGLLLTGEVEPRNAAVDRFVNFIRQQQLTLELLYAAFEGNRPVAASMILPSAGNTAIALCSPVINPLGAPPTAQVIRRAIEDQAQGQAKIVQSLTEPAQRLERRAFAQANFDDLATLVYMARDVPKGISAPSIHLKPRGSESAHGRGRLTSLHWAPRYRQAFEHAVLESYVNTLDCPGLLGLRSIGEVIDGHMATGKFDPRLWWAFYDGENPVAVLLLARVPQRQAHELVYLGVSEAYRSLGLGAKLVELALHSVSKRGGGRIFLAVDQRNEPAVNLYRRHQFRIQAHKRAMIHPLG